MSFDTDAARKMKKITITLQQQQSLCSKFLTIFYNWTGPQVACAILGWPV